MVIHIPTGNQIIHSHDLKLISGARAKIAECAIQATSMGIHFPLNFRTSHWRIIFQTCDVAKGVKHELQLHTP